MASMTFDLVQQLVDRLSAVEQLQLLAYLAPKLAGTVKAPAGSPPPATTTWAEFFALGEELADPSGQSITAAVIAMRR